MRCPVRYPAEKRRSTSESITSSRTSPGRRYPSASARSKREERQVVVVHAAERERRVARAHAGHHAGKLGPDGLKLHGKVVRVHQADEHEALDPAGGEDPQPSARRELRVVQPEAVEVVPKAGGPLLASLDVDRDRGVVLERPGVQVCVHKRQLRLETARARGAQLGHELGDDRVRPVAEALGLGLHLAPRRGGDLGAAPQREGDGVLRVTQRARDVLEGGSRHGGGSPPISDFCVTVKCGKLRAPRGRAYNHVQAPTVPQPR